MIDILEKQTQRQMPKRIDFFRLNTAHWHRHLKKSESEKEETKKKRTYTHSKQCFVFLLVEYR